MNTAPLCQPGSTIRYLSTAHRVAPYAISVPHIGMSTVSAYVEDAYSRLHGASTIILIGRYL
eukprot:3802883-Rhodomonas_salina.1